MDFEILKNRMTNGTPFLKVRALDRIRNLADNLEITEAQMLELKALAEAHGLEVLPEDAMGRLKNVEEAVNAIIEGKEPANAES